MPVRFLSDAELARLSGWPDEIADADLITYFTLTSDDSGWLTSNVRVENRLGAALQLCTLPCVGVDTGLVARRDISYQGCFPMLAAPEGPPVDRGHVIPHLSGGAFGPVS